MGKPRPKCTVVWRNDLRDYVCKGCEEIADHSHNFCPECGEHLRWPKKLHKKWYLS